MAYPEMKVAMGWGLTPASWYEEPRWSRLYMVATSRARNWVEYWLAESASEGIVRNK